MENCPRIFYQYNKKPLSEVEIVTGNLPFGFVWPRCQAGGQKTHLLRLWQQEETQQVGMKNKTLLPGLETGFCREEEIRTLDTVTDIHAFQACPFNHSGTSL